MTEEPYGLMRPRTDLWEPWAGNRPGPPGLPQRTGITQLTDDELLLFDFMFDKRLEQRHLERDDYSFHMNVRYSHSLDSEQLREALIRLAAQGLVVATTDGSVTRWSLTPLGGSQWELERR